MIALIGGLPSLYFYTTLFKSRHQEYKEAEYIPGIMPPIGYGERLRIVRGLGSSFTYYYDGNGIYRDFIEGIGCAPPNQLQGIDFNRGADFGFKLLNGYCRLSLKIIDYRTKATIAQIHDNQWFIKPKNINDYASGDKFLEILDQYGNVALRIVATDSREIKIVGYFVGHDCTVIFKEKEYVSLIPNDDPDYLHKVEVESSKNKAQYCNPFSK